MIGRRRMIVVVLLAPLVLFGCQTGTDPRILGASESQVQLRSFQSRAFDTTDKEKTLRTVIATLQDLGFVVDKADSILAA